MRLDVFLAESGLAKSRSAAKQMIVSGAIKVGGTIVDKPSFETDGTSVEIVGDICPFVSRGGLKLDAALDRFGIDVTGRHCIDVGASTGGFTDCLLKHGASFVLAVDCGHGQLDPSLAADIRVRQIDGVNARDIDGDLFGETFDVCVMDLSFISQTLVHRNVASLMKIDGVFITLIKPQFEAGRKALNKKGIVKNEKIREEAVNKVIDSAVAHGFAHAGTIESPISGGDGNIEYLAYFKYKGGQV